MDIRQLLHTIRDKMDQEFGSRLQGVVLFGSWARGDSDVDVLVLLQGPVKLAADLGRIGKRLYPLTLGQPENPIHVMPADSDAYAAGKSALYRRVAVEGIVG